MDLEEDRPGQGAAGQVVATVLTRSESLLQSGALRQIDSR